MATLDPVWEKRWADLNDALTATARRYESLTVARMPTLYSLIKCLQAFGESQFRFFRAGVNDGGPYRLAGCRAEYALSVVLDQVAIDLNCIQLAAAQRLFANENSTWRETLEKADRFAWRCLPYAEQGSDKTDTTVVTYFQKIPSIRVIPYAPVALIGIPFSCVSVTQDYLAIPHEVGHYMYWHKRNLRKDIATASSIQRWAEEIFADVYGCLIAGPVIAADFQDLQLRFSDEDFLADDDEHPIPAIRPMIYHRILELLQERNSELVKPYAFDNEELPILSERWQLKLSERKLEPVAGSNFKVQQISAQPQEATSLSSPEVEKVIQAALKVLFEDSKSVAGKTEPILSQKWWDSTPPQNQAPDKYALDLFEQFGRSLVALDSQLPRELVIEGAGVNLSGKIEPISVPTNDLTSNSQTDLTPLWTRWVKNEQLLVDPENLSGTIAQGKIKLENESIPGWEPVLSAGGWVTKGPIGRK